MGNASGLYQCPSCMQSISFRHGETNYLVCKSCNSTIHRTKEDTLVKNTSLEMEQPYELLQPGTTGAWNGKQFTILGRMRLWMEETVFNYWTILYRDGSLGMLSEGYGLYSMLTKRTIDTITRSHAETLAYNKARTFGDDTTGYYLQRKYIAKKCELEGEVLFHEWKEALHIFELSSMEGTHVELHGFIHNMVVMYDVVNTSFNELSFSNTRKSSFKGKTFSCPYCTASIVVKAWPYSQSCACTGCKTRYDLKPNGQFAVKGTDEADIKFELTLGLTGSFDNTLYEVVGCAQKQELNIYKSRWKEYTLYNAAEGYAFLSEYNGHWIFVKERADKPVLQLANDTSFKYGVNEFKLFNDYTAKVVDSVGEFPYNIYDDQPIRIREYINPPQMWISERSSGEGVNWFHAKHLPKSKVSNEFGVGLPWKIGIGAIEPKGYIETKKVMLATGVMLLLALIVHAIMASNMREKVLLENIYTIPDTLTTAHVVTDKFDLTKWKSNLAFDISAPVSNSWFELGITLVNANTGEEFTLEQGIEYYSGYEGGESWSEGRNAETAYLSSIPAGTYFMNLTASCDPSHKVNDFQLRVTNDVPMARNMWLIIAFIAIWPFGKALLGRYYERERWRHSNYSPYHYES